MATSKKSLRAGHDSAAAGITFLQEGDRGIAEAGGASDRSNVALIPCSDRGFAQRTGGGPALKS